jgi:hypothetical protein
VQSTRISVITVQSVVARVSEIRFNPIFKDLLNCLNLIIVLHKLLLQTYVFPVPIQII